MFRCNFDKIPHTLCAMAANGKRFLVLLSLYLAVVTVVGGVIGFWVYFATRSRDHSAVPAADVRVGAQLSLSDGRLHKTPKQFCAIPFKYKGKLYNRCTTDDARREWCSLTTQYNGSWDFCVTNLVPLTRCKFPFTYRGDTYIGCTNKDSTKYWCSFTTHYSGEWAYCDANRPSSVRPAKGCIFPFVYKGRSYTSCISHGSKHNWCSTAPRYSRDKWKYCDDTDPAIKAPPSCIFPFFYKNEVHHSCTLRDEGYYWCSASVEYSPMSDDASKVRC